MYSRCGWLGALVIMGLGLGARAQGAQGADAGTFNVERFRPALDRHGVLDVESGEARGHLDIDLGLVGGYALNPLVVVDSSGRAGALVAHRVGTHLTASLGLFSIFSLGLELPVVVFQAADVESSRAAVKDLAAGDASAAALGDLRIMPKLQLLARDQALVDVALMPSLTLPTNMPRGSWSGEESLTFTPEIAVSRPFLRGDRLRTAVNVGYRLRPDKSIGGLDVGQEVVWRVGLGYGLHDVAGVPVELNVSGNGGIATLRQQGEIAQNPVEAAAGVTWDVFGPLQVYAAVGGGVVAGFGTPDLRVFGGVRFAPPSVRDRDGDGIDDDKDGCPDAAEDKDGFEDGDGCPDEDNDKDGITDGADACPDVSEDKDSFQDQDGCPDEDNDGDGIIDRSDRCPLEPEDKDGFEDGDGCLDPDDDKDGVLDTADNCRVIPGVPEHQGCPRPDQDGDTVPDATDQCPDLAGPVAQGGCPDTDGDGIADPKDKCPKEPEIINGVDDSDGCPDKGVSKVVITRTKIEILDKVYFDVNKDSIQKRSYGLLQQVAAVLKNNPQLSKIVIEGHTDSDGSDASNLDLSQRRTESVKRFLIAENIGTERLDAIGFGESRPAVDNTTKANKEKNRRVEFRIAEVDGKAVSPDVPAPTSPTTGPTPVEPVVRP